MFRLRENSQNENGVGRSWTTDLQHFLSSLFSRTTRVSKFISLLVRIHFNVAENQWSTRPTRFHVSIAIDRETWQYRVFRWNFKIWKVIGRYFWKADDARRPRRSTSIRSKGAGRWLWACLTSRGHRRLPLARPRAEKSCEALFVPWALSLNNETSRGKRGEGRGREGWWWEEEEEEEL